MKTHFVNMTMGGNEADFRAIRNGLIAVSDIANAEAKAKMHDWTSKRVDEMAAGLAYLDVIVGRLNHTLAVIAKENN
ncbi:hypothetical protein EBZ80_25815 [bacterium]|nr:hypothetical protein [bacterium]